MNGEARGRCGLLVYRHGHSNSCGVQANATTHKEGLLNPLPPASARNLTEGRCAELRLMSYKVKSTQWANIPAGSVNWTQWVAINKQANK